MPKQRDRRASGVDRKMENMRETQQTFPFTHMDAIEMGMGLVLFDCPFGVPSLIV